MMVSVTTVNCALEEHLLTYIRLSFADILVGKSSLVIATINVLSVSEGDDITLTPNPKSVCRAVHNNQCLVCL